ncbi:MAG: hypothetical protein VR69_11525 [Peptococcaceae bacterium BRH_c4b]|nr:MAG: hypothetical protein VR69_11525 [Peptococcaceae bacterium BRH_c4b]
MAYISPLRGLRYNTALVPDLAEVITPPYDVIDAEEQDRYYRRHPYNIIRLEYGKTYPGDDDQSNRYSRAAVDFALWQEKGILAIEDKPAVYIYKQQFTAGGETKTRLGIMAGVKIEPYEKGVVLPHEETLPKHKADRLSLMQACGANFSPIFGLYSDPDKLVEKITAESLDGEPDNCFKAEDGQQHMIWAIKDNNLIAQIQQALKEKIIFIADGHHRYETALNYRNIMRGRDCDAKDGLQPYDFVMMTLVNLYDPGLVVFPTHRLVKNLPDQVANELVFRLQNNFEIEPFPIRPGYGNFKDFMDTLAARGFLNISESTASHNHAFGLYTGNGSGYILTIRRDTNIDKFMPKDRSRAWRGLDVSVLHTLIMEEYLGIGGEQRASESNLTYTREEENAMKKVDSGEYQMVFFLNPTLVEEVTEVAANGEKMPQKSTFFYPKLPTGILIAKLT